MSKKKNILILGVTGQDGSFLAKFLQKKNYFINGLVRKSSTGNLNNIKDLLNKKNLSSMINMIKLINGVPIF